MRRFIAYIALCSALILGVGAAISPTIVKANTDLAYSTGKTLTFRVSTKDAEKNRTGYDPTYALTEADGMDPVNEIADTMRARLDTWGSSEYSVTTVGYNTITVSLRTSGNDDTVYSYLEQYLGYSGGDIEVDAAYKTETDPYPDYSHDDLWTTIFDKQTARIEYIQQSGVSSFPVVVLPMTATKEAYTSFNNLIKFCNTNTKAADSSAGTSGETCSLLLWANRHGSDFYYSGQTDENVLSRILVNESVANDNAVWYATSDTKKESPSLQIIPSSTAISGGKYDSSKASQAYQAAFFVMNMLNATSLNYQVDFLYAETTSATVEEIVNYGAWTVNAAMSRTLIATLVAFAVVAVILAFFDRMMALSIVSVSAATVYLTFLCFVMFGSQFNIAALIGLLIIGLVSIFSGLYYMAKLKDELYKGRTLKKAHSEAAKKAVWPTIDASLIAIIIGVFVYIFAGDLARKMGVVLVMGGFINALMNLAYLRLCAWMLCNDNGMQSSFPKMLNVQKDKIPDMLKEEKQTYFGPYEKTDFTKSKKAVGILAAVMTVAGIATMITFGVLKGTVYNEAAANAESTVLYIEARSDSSDSNTNSVRSITDIYDEADSGSILRNVFLDGKDFSDQYKTIEVSETPFTAYSSDPSVPTRYWYIFTVSFKTHYNLANTETYPLTVTDASDHSKTVSFENFDDAFTYAVVDYYATNAETVQVSVKNVVPSEGVPYLSSLSLGVGVGLAVTCLYLMIRYRISRGFTASLLAMVAGYGSVAFFVFTRISVTPIVALGSVGTVIFTLLAMLFILQKEKEIYRDSREKDKANLAFRSECLKLANSRASGELILFALVAAYLAIDYFGFGPAAYASPYLNLIIGIAYGTVLSLALLTPISLLIAKLLSKIHFSLPHHKKKNPNGLQMKKNNSAEPEEAVFIGIND